MRAVLTKVKHASVTIDGELKGKIGRGFLILLGVAPDDTEEKCRKMADKLCSLRIFDDENDKINLSLDDVGGELLIVSQFTLYGNCRKGRRPSFSNAGDPAWSREMFDRFTRKVSEESGRPVPTGVFGADMRVHLINWGPVTIWLDSREVLPHLYL